MATNSLLPRLINLTILLILVQLTFVTSKTLVWSDEFNEPNLNESIWSFEWGNNHGWYHNELEFYTNRTQNVFIEDGHLVINAIEERFHDCNYTSGRIFTKNKADFLYGRMEIRAKLPKGQGLWPAIWMLPTNHVHGPGIASGEIDIMELLGHHPNTVYVTVHYGKSLTDRGHKSVTYFLPNETFADNFHVFAVDWNANNLIFWIDTNIVLTFNRSDVPSQYVYPFDAYFYFVLNVAVGGIWPGNPDESTHFPQRMEIDYIRVYHF